MELSMMGYNLRGYNTGTDLTTSLFGTVLGNVFTLFVGSFAAGEDPSFEPTLELPELTVYSKVPPFLETNLGFYPADIYYIQVLINGSHFRLQGTPVDVTVTVPAYEYTIVSQETTFNCLSLSMPTTSTYNLWRVSYPSFINYVQFPGTFTGRTNDILWSLLASFANTTAIYAKTDCTSFNSCYVCDGNTKSCAAGTGCFNVNNSWTCQTTGCTGASCGDTFYECQPGQSTNGSNLGQFTCLGVPSIRSCQSGSCPQGKRCLPQAGTEAFTCQFPDEPFNDNVVSACPDATRATCGVTIKGGLSDGMSCPGICEGEGLECTQTGTIWSCTPEEKPLWRQGWFIALMIAIIVIVIVFIIFLIYYFSDSKDKKDPPAEPKKVTTSVSHATF